MFIFCGILMTLTVGLFMAMIFTSGIKKYFNRFIVGMAIALIVGFGIASLFQMEFNTDVKAWNNGTCTTCGTDYKLLNVEHLRNSGNLYYYNCENGHLIETHSYFNKND